jgi:hypothetical protein
VNTLACPSAPALRLRSRPSCSVLTRNRFSDPWGAIIEFQLDSAGAVTGLILQQGQLKQQAARIR